jgi:protein-disulfide isomerase
VSTVFRIALGVATVAVLAGAATLPFLVPMPDAPAPALPVAQVEQGGGFSQSQKTEIGQIARDFLLEHPEVLQDMAMVLQAREAEKTAALQKNAFSDHKNLIYSSVNQTVLGNPNGDVTLVEFFDYNCGYCRAALKDMDALLENDKNLKIVLKEFPVLGVASREVAVVASALRMQSSGLYLKFHNAVMSEQEPSDGAKALELAKKAGADMPRLARDMADPAIEEGIKESLAIGQRLGIDGTPSYVLADTVVPGAVGAEKLEAMITNVRKCKKVSCS